MKKIILASLMTICLAASASALDVKPYIGFFPISYTSYTYTYGSGTADVDDTTLNIGFAGAPIIVGVKIADFRTDFEFADDNQNNVPVALKGFNFYYDFMVSDALIPYVKLGIGYHSWTNEQDIYKIELTQSTCKIGAGLGYKITGNLILDAGADYVIGKNKEKDTAGAVTNTNKENYSGFSVQLGARYEF